MRRSHRSWLCSSAASLVGVAVAGVRLDDLLVRGGMRSRCLAMSAAVVLAACSRSERPAEHGSGAPVVPAAAPRDAGGADDDPRFDSASLESLRFEVTGGSPEARAHFDRGLLALHSFWYAEATTQFEAAIAADPTFRLAYWGLAMSHAKILWGDDDISAGRHALARILSPQTLPHSEQAWIMAAVALFNRDDVQQSRKDFLATMEQVHAALKADESALFLALALLGTLRPGAPNETELRERAAGLALDVFARNPKHPGAAHYAIHALDTPALAARAVPAAELYASIAPAAFHAQHMPSHIFARLGRWKDATKSCQTAWDVSVAWAKRAGLSPEQYDFHSLAWLVEIGFERGRPADASTALAMYGEQVKAGLSHGNRAAYANLVASYLARTGAWARLDELLAPLAAPAQEGEASAHMAHGRAHGPMPNHAPTELFARRAVLGARARAAAMTKDVAALNRVLAERDEVDAQLRPFLEQTQGKPFVDSADAIRKLVRDELLARARGDDRALLASLAPLAKDQNDEFTGEGMPGGLLYEEELAATLARLGKTKEALAAYREVIAHHPGRTTAVLRAARAARKLDDLATARAYYARVVELWQDADSTTEGLAEARAAVAAKK